MRTPFLKIWVRFGHAPPRSLEVDLELFVIWLMGSIGAGLMLHWAMRAPLLN